MHKIQLLKEANNLIQNQKYESALKLYIKLLDEFGYDNPSLCFNMAYGILKIKKINKKIKNYNEINKLNSIHDIYKDENKIAQEVIARIIENPSKRLEEVVSIFAEEYSLGYRKIWDAEVHKKETIDENVEREIKKSISHKILLTIKGVSSYLNNNENNQAIYISQPINHKIIEEISVDEKAAYDEFDAKYYYSKYETNRKQFKEIDKLELFRDFIADGWRQNKNPNDWFDVAYYLKNNKDISDANINPFLHFINHGRKEGRDYQSSRLVLSKHFSNPKISVIVPNYNHAKYLSKRLESIENQTYKNLEIILLDDNSSDESRDILNNFKEKSKHEVKLIFNEVNGGNVFKQWQIGINAAVGDLVWICESDDYAENNFIEELVEYFKDPSVMIAFGRIQFCNQEGLMLEGLDEYRESSEPKIWDQPIKRSAKEWFDNSFSISNIIPNVGGCLIRRVDIPLDIWKNAIEYKVCGDWYLYLKLCNSGRIVFNPKAITYFRQHHTNTSVNSFGTINFYQEHLNILSEIKKYWNISKTSYNAFYSKLIYQYNHFNCDKIYGEFNVALNLNDRSTQQRVIPHILIVLLGFSLGGGEIFPIILANELKKKGLEVSCLIISHANYNHKIRKILNSNIPIYFLDDVASIGIDEFIDANGIDLIHTHNITADDILINNFNLKSNIPYLSTLHGSYEVSNVSIEKKNKIISRVNFWYYLSPKNIDHLPLNFPCDKKILVRNGFPLNLSEFHKSRSDLGIDENAFVFVIASRAIPEKGWVETILALNIVRASSGKNVELILVGDGEILDDLVIKYSHLNYIKFLGYQENVHGIYRLADCVLLPSRFKGESFPLSLIQAMQVGKPIIATDIGEIASMLLVDNFVAGVLIENNDDINLFVANIVEGMLKMFDSKSYSFYSNNSAHIGKQYDIKDVADFYINSYNNFILT